MPAAWTDGTLRRSNVTGRDAAADCPTGRVRPACSVIYYRRKTVTKSCESLYHIHYMLCFRRSNNMNQRQIPFPGGALPKVSRRAHFPDLRVSCGRLRDVVLPCSTNNSAIGRTGRKRMGSNILCPHLPCLKKRGAGTDSSAALKGAARSIWGQAPFERRGGHRAAPCGHLQGIEGRPPSKAWSQGWSGTENRVADRP